MPADGESWFRACAACGASLTDGESHPVSVGTPRECELPLYSFCDHDCLARWRDTREAGGEEATGRDGRDPLDA
jgi:hypothetical protein